MTKLYYRIDNRSGDCFTNRKPISKEQRDKLKYPEQNLWFKCSCEDKDMKAYRLHKINCDILIKIEEDLCRNSKERK